MRILFALLSLGLFSFGFAAEEPKRQPPRNYQAQIRQLLRQTPNGFLRQQDKDNDQKLARNELPFFLRRGFDRMDADKSGGLELKEITAAFQAMRRRFGNAPNPRNNPNVEQFRRYLQNLDTNKDQKISKKEARGGMAANFDRLDGNKDGFLDRNELARMIARFGQRDNPRSARQPADFDSFDDNADGRLTRAEVAETPLAARFDALDKDKSGKIDPKEFEAFAQQSQRD